MTTKKQFYVYAHCRPDGEPFYIGKGLLSRAYSWKPRNPHHKNVMMKYGTDNLMIRAWPCASENEAFMCEIAMIAELRALGIKLTNITLGGEGASGVVPSTEVRAKIAEAVRGNKSALGHRKSDAFKAALSARTKGARHAAGHVVPQATREEWSRKRKGKPWSEARRAAHKSRLGIPRNACLSKAAI